MTYLPPPGPEEPVPVQPYYPPAPYQQPYQQQPYYGYPTPYGYMPYPPSRPTEGLAIASLVVSCVSALGLCAYGIGGLLGIVGAILGHVARRRIRVSGADGEGMALAGVIVGWVAAAIGVLAVVGIVLLFTLGGDSDSTTT
jgi:Domain of unknown function (DUF4190)